MTGIPKDQRWVTHCSCCEIPANASYRMTQSLDPNKSWQTSTSRAANFSRDGLVTVHPVREGRHESSTLKRSTHQQLQCSIPVLADHTTGIRISLIQFQPFYDLFRTPAYFYDSVIFQKLSKHVTILPLKRNFFCFSLYGIKIDFFFKTVTKNLN